MPLRSRSIAFAVAVLIAAVALPAVGQAQVDAAASAAAELQAIDRLARERHLDEAMRRLEALLERSPRNVQARFLRAVLLGEAARSDEAAAAFEAMTQEFPELPEPYNNLAVIHAAAGRYEVARVLLLRALEVAPNYVTAQENLGDLYLAMAADVYARALALDPGNAELARKLQRAREAAVGLRAGR